MTKLVLLATLALLVSFHSTYAAKTSSEKVSACASRLNWSEGVTALRVASDEIKQKIFRAWMEYLTPYSLEGSRKLAVLQTMMGKDGEEHLQSVVQASLHDYFHTFKADIQKFAGLNFPSVEKPRQDRKNFAARYGLADYDLLRTAIYNLPVQKSSSSRALSEAYQLASQVHLEAERKTAIFLALQYGESEHLALVAEDRADWSTLYQMALYQIAAFLSDKLERYDTKRLRSALNALSRIHDVRLRMQAQALVSDFAQELTSDDFQTKVRAFAAASDGRALLRDIWLSTTKGLASLGYILHIRGPISHRGGTYVTKTLNQPARNAMRRLVNELLVVGVHEELLIEPMVSTSDTEALRLFAKALEAQMKFVSALQIYTHLNDETKIWEIIETRTNSASSGEKGQMAHHLVISGRQGTATYIADQAPIEERIEINRRIALARYALTERLPFDRFRPEPPDYRAMLEYSLFLDLAQDPQDPYWSSLYERAEKSLARGDGIGAGTMFMHYLFAKHNGMIP